MVFDLKEMQLILRKHVHDTFGIPFESLSNTTFTVEEVRLGVATQLNGEITIATEGVVPKGMGPYRTPSR